jgi:hypothetical protein
MIDTAELLPDLQKLIKVLHADLVERSQERPEVAARLKAGGVRPGPPPAHLLPVTDPLDGEVLSVTNTRNRVRSIGRLDRRAGAAYAGGGKARGPQEGRPG